MEKFITARGFTTDICYLDDLPISNFLYNCDSVNGETILLEAKNSIYLCDKMDDSLLNPIQAEEVGVWVDNLPKRYYLYDLSAQLVSFMDGIKIPFLYDCSLPYLTIRRPTKDEVHNFKRLQLSSRDTWGPFLFNGNCYRMESLTGQIDMELLVDDVTKVDPIGR